MKSVVITGAGGVVGTVLTKGLASDCNAIPLSRQDCDLTNFEAVKSTISDNTDVIIHLAWKEGDIYKNGTFDHDNILMTLNVYEAAAQKNIPRVIIASSVHTNEYRSNNAGGPKRGAPSSAQVIRALDGAVEGQAPLPLFDWPTSIYGATKVYLEALGKYYAQYRGIEVIAVRLGGVNLDNSPSAKQEVDYDKIFLSHQDLVQTFRQMINHKKIPENFYVFYLISNNPGKLHPTDTIFTQETA